ncbi:MAG: DUF6178 family protein [Desulfobacteraceae bacterium]
MEARNDYKLENLVRKEKKLAATKNQVLTLDGEKALDALLSSNQPATLVQSFSDQDLYFLLHHIGSQDFVPVLAMASSEQWEYILDMEVWHNDRIHLPQVTTCFDLLFQADGQRLMRWLVREKVELFEYFLFKNLEVRIREHDEDPSDFKDGYTTIDNIFYFRFPEIPDLPETADAGETEQFNQLCQVRDTCEELIMKMLNMAADMDLSVFQALLMESCSVIPSEVEEEEFRLKNMRLAEKGFLPFYEAVGIYQPVEVEELKPRTGRFLAEPLYNSDLPLPPQYPSSMLLNDTLFARALSLIDDDNTVLNLQLEFASLVNLLISADRKNIRDRSSLEAVVAKGCSYLSLGLEIVHGNSRACLPENGAAVIRKYRLEDIFRVGSGASIRLKAEAKKWHKASFIAEKGLPLTFLGEQWLGVVGGLLLEKPLFFDNYATGELYREFASLADIRATEQTLDRIMEMDRVVHQINPDIDEDFRGRLSYTVLILTLWARDRLALDIRAAPIAMVDFRKFFAQLFKGSEKKRIDKVRRRDLYLWLSERLGRESSVKILEPFFERLFDELEEEYGSVSPDHLDVNIITHFLLKH